MRSADKMTEDCQAAFWNERSDDFAKDINKKKGRKRTADILGFLEEAGFRTQGAHILDIGCGPGTLSLPLARAGANVTSVDIASGMLDRLKETADREGLPVKTTECSWWTADIEKLGFRNKFDLVIACMTPAIRDEETLNRMMACSRNYCYYIHLIQRGGGTAHQDILPEIFEMRPRPQSMGLLFPFMYLYINDYRPLIRFRHERWKETVEWTEVADRAIDFLKHIHSCDEATEKKIRKYYKKSAQEMKFRPQPEAYSGMMLWTVSH